MGLKKDHKGAQSYGAKGLEMGLRALKQCFWIQLVKYKDVCHYVRKNSDNLSQLRPLNCRGRSVKNNTNQFTIFQVRLQS